jgi:hypothetical protein
MLKKSSTLREVKVEAQVEASNLHSTFSSTSSFLVSFATALLAERRV